MSVLWRVEQAAVLLGKILGVAVELSWMPTLQKDKPRLQKLGIELVRMPT